jgi:hypothetical protein
MRIINERLAGLRGLATASKERRKKVGELTSRRPKCSQVIKRLRLGGKTVFCSQFTRNSNGCSDPNLNTLGRERGEKRNERLGRRKAEHSSLLQYRPARMLVL